MLRFRTDPDRNWQNFHFSYSTVRIDFSNFIKKPDPYTSSIRIEIRLIKLTLRRFRIKIKCWSENQTWELM